MIRAALLAALLLLAVSPADATAPRPAPDPTALLHPVDVSGAGERASDPTRTGAPLDPAPVPAPSSGDARQGGAPSPAVAAPGPTSIGGRPEDLRPTPSGVSTPAPIIGVASWYDDGPGLYAAVPGWHWGDTPYGVVVCVADPELDDGTSRCVTVTVRDCLCGRRDRLIDLSPAAFVAVCGPLRLGLCRVAMEVLR